MGREVAGEGGKWGERGREVGLGYPPAQPLITNSVVIDMFYL